MPSAGQISFVHDQTRMRWMTSLTSGRFQPPLVLPEGDTIDFVFRWSNNGTLFTPAVTPVWIFGIKDATTPSGDFLVQVNTASANAGVYTFTVPISSAELQTWLSTATSQSYVALQITDTANGIATTPLLCQITANQNDSGTTPTSANGTLDVAAGKTVTFPLSLTFPSAAGTNGQQLTLSNSTTGLLEWAASGSSGITLNSTTTTGFTAGRILYSDGSVVQQYAISGTGSVAMTTSPSFTTPTLGAATATSINGKTIQTGAGKVLDSTAQTLTSGEQLQARTNIGGPIIKAGSGTTRSSTSFATDSEFSVAVGAGETWKLDYNLFFLEGNGAGAKAQLVFDGMTISEAMGMGYYIGAVGSAIAILATDGTSPFEVINLTDDFYHIVDFTMTFTATVGGTVLLQWAAEAAFDVTLLSRSTVTATRVS